MCVYDGYPKRIAKDFFGSHKEDKMFVKYKYKVLDDDYVNNLKAKRIIVLEEKCQNLLKDNYKIHLEMRHYSRCIASTPVQYRSGRIINYQINSYFWNKLLKSFHRDMNLILGPTQRQ